MATDRGRRADGDVRYAVPSGERSMKCAQVASVLSSMGRAYRHARCSRASCRAIMCLRHQPSCVGLPRRFLLQRRIALARADARRHSTSDAALSRGNPRLDQPAWRPDAAAHHDARPGSGGVLSALQLTVTWWWQCCAGANRLLPLSVFETPPVSVVWCRVEAFAFFFGLQHTVPSP